MLEDKVCLICWRENKWSTIKSNQQRKHLREVHADLTGPEVPDADIDKIEEGSFVTIEKFQEMLKAPKRPEEEKQEEGMGLLQETEEDKRLKSEKDQAMEFAPGDWLIWFLTRSQISLSADDKMVIRAQYKENLPDARAFEAMLQKTFGLPQSAKVSKSAWVYAFYLNDYLEYKRRKQEQTFSLPEGSVQVGHKVVPGIVSYPPSNVPVLGQSPNYIYPGQGHPGQSTVDQYGRPVDQYGRPLTGQPRDDGETIEEMRKLSRTVGALVQKVERMEATRVPEEEPLTPPSGGRPFTAIPRRGGGVSTEVNPEIAKLTKVVEDLRTDNAQRARREQEAEERRKADEERRRWIDEINRGVGVQLAPILDRVEKVEKALTTSPPLDLKGLSVSDLLTLTRERQRYNLEEDKLDLARHKYESERRDSAAFRSDLVAGVQKVGDQVGEVIGRVITQQPVSAGPIQTTPRGDNMVQFPCERCHKPIIADKRAQIVTCLSCGAQYTMATMAPAPATSTPPAPEQTGAETGGHNNITIVPPSGTPQAEEPIDSGMPG
jgi:hypothetical protein